LWLCVAIVVLALVLAILDIAGSRRGGPTRDVESRVADPRGVG
jgi:hypothetical protein